MDAVRRVHREQMFRLGMQILSGGLEDEAAGRAFSALAEACMQAPWRRSRWPRRTGSAALSGRGRGGGDGQAGSREMTAGSDLDLMAVYQAEPGAMSEAKGWAAETVFGRFTQRLVAALTAPTAEGGLCNRPAAPALRRQGAGRGQPEGAGRLLPDRGGGLGDPGADPGAGGLGDLARVRAGGVGGDRTALRRARSRKPVFAEAGDMRALMARERPARGFWDLKFSVAAQVDAEFAAQALQAACAGEAGRCGPARWTRFPRWRRFDAPSSLMEPLAARGGCTRPWPSSARRRSATAPTPSTRSPNRFAGGLPGRRAWTASRRWSLGCPGRGRRRARPSRAMMDRRKLGPCQFNGLKAGGPA